MNKCKCGLNGKFNPCPNCVGSGNKEKKDYPFDEAVRLMDSFLGIGKALWDKKKNGT